MDAREQFVVFTLDDFRYGLPFTTVERVVRVVEVTPLPKAPEIVSGVVNDGGRVIPVIEVRKRLGLAQRMPTLSDVLILASTSRRALALLVDAVGELVSVHPQEIIPADEVAPHTRYLKGLAKLEDGLVLIQDLDAFLSLEEEQSLDDALRQGER